MSQGIFERTLQVLVTTNEFREHVNVFLDNSCIFWSAKYAKYVLFSVAVDDSSGFYVVRITKLLKGGTSDKKKALTNDATSNQYFKKRVTVFLVIKSVSSRVKFGRDGFVISFLNSFQMRK